MTTGPRPAPDPLLDDLDDDQREAVTTPAAPLAIHAGAGSGKTRVLTRRIAWRAREGLLDPARVLTVTFTRKAAGELVSRLRTLGVVGADGAPSVTAGTIHSIALAQLRRRALDEGRTPPEILERKLRLLVPLVGGRGPEATVAAMEAASEIEWAKTRLLRPDDYVLAATRAAREPSRPFEKIAEVYARYEESKRKKRLADFEDLVWWCADALERDREFATAQRWRFQHFFVDEFQDTSPAQLRLLRAWLGQGTDLCVVGDPDQAIFAFAGAESGYLVGFGREFPGGRTVHLRTNYRCTPEIVGAANALLADGGSRRPAVRAASDSGPVPTVTEYESEAAEAAGVATLLRDAHTAGVPWHDLAVLYRTNAQSAALEEALAATGVPARVRGASRFLERPEVKIVLADLRTAATRTPDAPFTSLLQSLVSDADADDAVTEEQREHLDAVVRLGHEYTDTEAQHAAVPGFLAFLTATLRDDAPVGADAVELLTFHRAKGLEFHTVCIVGLERGLVPISHAETPDQRWEERRLLYVALTRAGRELHLSWARTRSLGSRTANRVASPWLEPIVTSWRGAPAPTPVDPLAGIAASRRRLAAVTTEVPAGDAACFEALREWRGRRARAASVPAYVIFNDATLRAVAANRPRSTADLLALPGIGPVKVERYGTELLEVVSHH
ncbi:MAG: ATP-dependent DNA helicase UvrD2 [Actinomycetes bacterium]